MFKELKSDTLELTSVSIGMDAVLTTAATMGVTPNEKNIIDIARATIEETGTPQFDVVLAIIVAHKDVSGNEELKKFILDSWQLMK